MCLTAPSLYLLLSECFSFQQGFQKVLWLGYRHNIDTFQRSSKITMAELETAKPILLPFALIVQTCFLWFKYQCFTFCSWADFASHLFYLHQGTGCFDSMCWLILSFFSREVQLFLQHPLLLRGERRPKQQSWLKMWDALHPPVRKL